MQEKHKKETLAIVNSQHTLTNLNGCFVQKSGSKSWYLRFTIYKFI